MSKPTLLASIAKSTLRLCSMSCALKQQTILNFNLSFGSTEVHCQTGLAIFDRAITSLIFYLFYTVVNIHKTNNFTTNKCEEHTSIMDPMPGFKLTSSRVASSNDHQTRARVLDGRLRFPHWRGRPRCCSILNFIIQCSVLFVVVFFFGSC